MFVSTETWSFTGSSDFSIGESSPSLSLPGGVQRGMSQPIGMNTKPSRLTGVAAADWAVRAGTIASRRGSAIAAAVVISGGWLVHAVGRFEERALLMQLTVLHQLAAAVWVGGVVQLLGLWRAGRRDATLRHYGFKV